MKKHPKLKAWIVFPGYDPSREGCLFAFAPSRNASRLMGMAFMAEDYLHINARRLPELDIIANLKPSPWIATKNEELPEGFKFFTREI